MKTELTYAAILIALASVAGFFIAPGRELAIADIVLVKIVSVATYMAIALGMLAALRGVKYNVFQEVFDEHNTAGALFTGLLLIALALVIK